MQTVLAYSCYLVVLMLALAHGEDFHSRDKTTDLLQTENIFGDQSGVRVNPSLELIKSKNIVVKEPRRKNNRRRKNKKNSKRRNDLPLPDDPKEILRDTMRHMFGFEHMVPTPDTIQQNNIKSKTFDPDFDASTSQPGYVNHDQKVRQRKKRVLMPQPPNFMVELYRTYSQDNDLMMLHSRSKENTVRSFFPTPADPLLKDSDRGKPVTITPIYGKIDGQHRQHESQIAVFLFNLTSIPIPEAVVGAEIRLDGFAEGSEFKYSKQTTQDKSTNSTKENITKGNFASEWNVIAAVYTLSSTNCVNELDCVGGDSKIFIRVGKSTILSSATSTAWTANDFARIAKKARRPDHVMIVQFEPEKNEALSRQSRHTERDQVRTKTYDLPISFTVADNERTKRDSDYKKSKLYESGTSESQPQQDWFDTVSTNIPAIPILIIYCNDSRTSETEETSVTAPIIWRALENVTSSLRKRSRRSNPDDSPDPKGNTEVRKTRPQVVNKIKVDGAEYTGNKVQNRPNRERKRRRNCGGKRRRRGCSKSKKIKPHPSLANKQADTKCGRKSLHVDFADIEWSDWIISPTTFDAYYCTGLCDLPQMLKSGTTNHAVVQAVIRAEGRLDIPAPCCVPDKLLSLAVFFYDKDRNVVLKKYPKMSVETCMCR